MRFMRSITRDWSIGRKTTVSHMMVALVAIMLAIVLSYVFGYQNTRRNTMEELERQVIAIAQRESNFDIQQRASRGSLVSSYQELTNSAVFFIDFEGEAVHLQRYTPRISTGEAQADAASGNADDWHTDYSRIDLFDQIDKKFIDRVIAGETVSAVQKFVFADGVIVFAGAPIIKEDGRIVGGIILAQPVEILRSVGRELSVVLLIPLVLSVALACILATGQTRMLVRPVMRMIRVARKLSEGNYGHRIAVETNDEIGELARTFNMLSIRLTEVIGSLREERDRLGLIIGSIGEGIIAVDHQLNMVHCNRAFLELMELEDESAFYASDREEIERVMCALRETVQTGTRRLLNFSTPTGRMIRAEVTPLQDAADGEIGAVCLLADVSEAQRMEQLRKEYVANISHELRTPLTGIRGMIEPLIDGCMETEDERQGCYQVIQKETVRLEKLVGEMLDLSRLQDGRGTVELERLELPGIIDSAVASMKRQAMDAGVLLECELDDGPLECIGNENRIAQVLVILMDNAIGFTPAGGRVTVFAREEEERVAIGVRDTGCGIEPKDLPFIWERFYKADRSRMRTKGTGLGLAIARRVVQLMGGEIRVVSEPGRGSEFTFTLNK